MENSNLAYDILKNLYEKKGYQFFDEGQFNLNIFGVRTKNKVADSFDDWIGVCYIDKENNRVCNSFRATTDAGTYWLKNPQNHKGTALLVPNQYKGAYKLGLHRGQYKALVQVQPMKVYRDNNKDIILDFNDLTIQEGVFGINIHRSNPLSYSKNVYKWSAGCQVFQSVEDYNFFIELCETAKRKYKNTFTYTLLMEEDFNAL
jgi:hypothetical protein